MEKTNELFGLEIPPVAVDAGRVVVKWYFAKWILFPILMFLGFLGGLIWGGNFVAGYTVALVVGCLLWIFSAIVGSFSRAFRNPETELREIIEKQFPGQSRFYFAYLRNQNAYSVIDDQISMSKNYPVWFTESVEAKILLGKALYQA